MTRKRQSVVMYRPDLDLGPGQEMIQRLLKIGAALSSEKDLRKLLGMIAAETRSLLSCDRATLFLVDRPTSQLIFHIVSEEELREVRLPLDKQSIAGYVGCTGEILQIEDAYEIPEDAPFRFAREFDQKTGFRTQSVLVVPLINRREEIMGVLQLINKKKNDTIIPFKASDRKMAIALAGQAAVSIENAQLYEEQAHFIDAFLRSMAAAVDARDPITAGHTRRVAMYTMALAHAYGKLDEFELKELYYAAWLHDVGKIGVREEVLNKATRIPEHQVETIRNRFAAIKAIRERDIYLGLLECYRKGQEEQCSLLEKEEGHKLEEEINKLDTDLDFITTTNRKGFLPDDELERLTRIKETTFVGGKGEALGLVNDAEFENLSIRRGNLNVRERRDIESHVEHTFDILSKIPFPKGLTNVPRFAAMHHEKINGQGYPFGLAGPQVVVQGRILAIADIYDALTAKDRPYKPAMPIPKAIAVLWGMVKEGHLDGDLLQIFLDHHLFLLEDSGEEFTPLTVFKPSEERIQEWESGQAQAAATPDFAARK